MVSSDAALFGWGLSELWIEQQDRVERANQVHQDRFIKER